MCDRAESLRWAFWKSDALWSPTFRSKRPIIWPLWPNYPIKTRILRLHRKGTICKIWTNLKRKKLTKKFKRSCQNCIQRVERNIWGGKNETTWKFKFFSDFQQKILGYELKKFRKSCQNCIPSVERTVLRSFPTNFGILIFSNFERKIFG